MASERNSLGPATNRLKFPDHSAAPLSLNRRDLETLFALLFDDSFDSSAHHVSTVSAAQPDNILLPCLRSLFDSSRSLFELLSVQMTET